MDLKWGRERQKELTSCYDTVYNNFIWHLKMKELSTSLIKTLLQQVNPGMSAEQVQVMIEGAQQSPPDTSSAPNDARRSIPPSPGSNHVSKDFEEDMM
ncbi:hypothetical protein HN51_047380 [Arachis hypogaea]